jgi:hypothetical protein
MSAYMTPWAIGAETGDDQAQIIDAEGWHVATVAISPLMPTAHLIANAPELARLLSRLAGFAAHHASDSAMAAGGRDLVAEARALLARIEVTP